MASKPFRRFLKLPLSDSGAADTLLVEISHPNPRPQDNLDGIVLTASNGTTLFKSRLRASQISKARLASSKQSGQDWISVLRYLIIDPSQYTRGEEPGRGFDRYPPGSLELSAALNQQDAIITVHQTISGRKQSLGTFTLASVKPSDDTPPFTWCVAAVESLADNEGKIATLKFEVARIADHAQKLQEQIDDFLKARQEQEDELLAKFVLLINEKKAEIRRLMTILRAAGLSTERSYEAEDTPMEAGMNGGGTRDGEVDVPSTRAARTPAAKNKAAGNKSTAPMARPGKRKQSSGSDDDQDIKEEKKSDDDGEDDDSAGAETDRDLSADERTDSDGAAEASKRPARSPPPVRPLPFRQQVPDDPVRVDEPRVSSGPDIVHQTAKASDSDDSDDEL